MILYRCELAYRSDEVVKAEKEAEQLSKVTDMEIEPDYPETPWVPCVFDLSAVTLYHPDTLPNGDVITAVFVAGEILFIRTPFEEFDRVIARWFPTRVTITPDGE